MRNDSYLFRWLSTAIALLVIADRALRNASASAGAYLGERYRGILVEAHTLADQFESVDDYA